MAREALAVGATVLGCFGDFFLPPRYYTQSSRCSTLDSETFAVAFLDHFLLDWLVRFLYDYELNPPPSLRVLTLWTALRSKVLRCAHSSVIQETYNNKLYTRAVYRITSTDLSSSKTINYC
jgi:hypothetical protein